MKKWIIVLLVWAVIATICVVLATKGESDSIDKYNHLASEYNELKATHKELEKEYADLETEHEEKYLKGLAYEMAYDSTVSAIKGEGWDASLSYAEIMGREKLSVEDMQTVLDYALEILNQAKQTS